MTSLGSNPSQVISTYIFPAQKFLKAKQFLKAKELLAMGERTYKFSADIQFLLAKAFKGLKDPATASQKVLKAVKFAPAYVHPKFNELELDPETIKDAYNRAVKIFINYNIYQAGKKIKSKAVEDSSIFTILSVGLSPAMIGERACILKVKTLSSTDKII